MRYHSTSLCCSFSSPFHWCLDVVALESFGEDGDGPVADQHLVQVRSIYRHFLTLVSTAKAIVSSSKVGSPGVRRYSLLMGTDALCSFTVYHDVLSRRGLITLFILL